MKHRIRVVGILCRDEHILLVEQLNPNTGHRRWTPPGGGLEISDPDIFAGVEREVFEETGLKVRAGRLRALAVTTARRAARASLKSVMACASRESGWPLRLRQS